jgi:hypothetical protein
MIRVESGRENLKWQALTASGPSSAMPPQAGGGPTSPAWWWAKKASTPISCEKRREKVQGSFSGFEADMI